jgi:GT2 family glycosyltransferase
MLGCPIQNREMVIDRYLDSILKLDYPKRDIHLNFLVNNSTDNTFNILAEFFDKYQEQYGDIHIVIDDNIAGGYVDQLNKRDYSKFAIIRNEWLSFLNPQDTHIFSIDSDCLVPADSLNRLLARDKDMVSILVENAPTFYNVLDYNPKTGYYKAVYPKPEGLVKTDLTAAVFLAKRELIDSGVKWGNAHQGEDVAFCEKAREQGFELYCDATMEAKHLKWEIHKL